MSGLLCFISETRIIIGVSPLETLQSVRGTYISTERYGQYRRFVGGVTVPHCSATDLYIYIYIYVSYIIMILYIYIHKDK